MVIYSTRTARLISSLSSAGNRNRTDQHAIRVAWSTKTAAGETGLMGLLRLARPDPRQAVRPFLGSAIGPAREPKFRLAPLAFGRVPIAKSLAASAPEIRPEPEER